MLLLNTKNNKVRQRVIRFRKKGIIRYPLFDIILTYKNLRNRSRAIEKLGFYNPNSRNKSFFLNVYRLSHWLTRGVFVNFTVKKYIVKFLLN